MQTSIPKELQSLVYWSIKMLGEGIEKHYGKDVYKLVESTRKKMKSIRSSDMEETLKVLKSVQKKYQKEGTQELKMVAHSYSLMLELINRCESAYRTCRLAKKEDKNYKNKPHAIIFVFTAHPTEARSPEVLFIFQQIYYALIDALENGKNKNDEKLKYLLSLALTAPIARKSKPTVEDEAKHLYSYILRNEILSQQIDFFKKGITVNFRSWVGGDKDGHPGVNEKTLQMSFNHSREKIVEWVEFRLNQVLKESELIHMNQTQRTALNKKFMECTKELKGLRKLKDEDGKRIVNFKKKFLALKEKFALLAKVEAPDLENIRCLLWLYPTMVLPLEIREDSELVHEAQKNEKMAIVKMLKKLKTLSKGYNPKWYVRGFVLSMVEGARDIEAGYKLTIKHLGSYAIPVVPLFENAFALKYANRILDEYFKTNPKVLKEHKQNWSTRFEVMLGYSDSSKESGVFPSRFLISQALLNMDEFLSKQGLTPVFFHGSGGSIERGGGSIKEQTQWWPKSAVNIFKATTQGEMVARNFAGDLIMKSQVEKIVDQLSYTNPKKHRADKKTLEKFSQAIQRSYQNTVQTDIFFEQILQATPYNYLDVLKIGSRPSKRQTGGRKLRAIPWVLCWTQARVLFPTWWGVGSAFESLTEKEQDEMKSIYNHNELLSSFVKSLGFTLRKVELSIWKLYLDQLDISKAEKDSLFAVFANEYELAVKFYRQITGEKNLLWFRPWLGQSIYFRSSMIHPLNLIQIEAAKRKDEDLLRETVTGIACGMMTTG